MLSMLKNLKLINKGVSFLDTNKQVVNDPLRLPGSTAYSIYAFHPVAGSACNNSYSSNLTEPNWKRQYY